jgi:hypothetical protein
MRQNSSGVKGRERRGHCTCDRCVWGFRSRRGEREQRGNSVSGDVRWQQDRWGHRKASHRCGYWALRRVFEWDHTTAHCCGPRRRVGADWWRKWRAFEPRHQGDRRSPLHRRRMPASKLCRKRLESGRRPRASTTGSDHALQIRTAAVAGGVGRQLVHSLCTCGRAGRGQSRRSGRAYRCGAATRGRSSRRALGLARHPATALCVVWPAPWMTHLLRSGEASAATARLGAET